jgi:hypothetical protein
LFAMEVMCSSDLLLNILPVHPKRHVSIEVPRVSETVHRTNRQNICYNYCFYIIM